VWLSSDGSHFQRVEGAEGLADDEGWHALASGAVWSGEEWVVVGGGTHGDSADREPLSWTSPDGHRWARVPLPAADGFEDVHRVVRVPGGRSAELLAVGLVADGFGVWRRDDGGWHFVTDFGSRNDDATAARYVAGLEVVDRGYVASVSDGAHYSLWRSEDGAEWERWDTPESPATGSGRTLALASADDQTLVLVATEERGSLWSVSSE
jgi:hypothetical protein